MSCHSQEAWRLYQPPLPTLPLMVKTGALYCSTFSIYVSPWDISKSVQCLSGTHVRVHAMVISFERGIEHNSLPEMNPFPFQTKRQHIFKAPRSPSKKKTRPSEEKRERRLMMACLELRNYLLSDLAELFAEWPCGVVGRMDSPLVSWQHLVNHPSLFDPPPGVGRHRSYTHSRNSTPLKVKGSLIFMRKPIREREMKAATAITSVTIYLIAYV